MIVYHMDYSKHFKKDDIIKPILVDNSICGYFPNGVSYWGNRHFDSKRAYNFEDSQRHVIETLFELYRKAYFPYRPSRYESLFALSSLDDLNFWPILKGFNIVIIDTQKAHCFKTDASYLISPLNATNFSNQAFRFLYAQFLDNAQSYWCGQVSLQPRPEILVSLTGEPVIVTDVITS